MTKDRDGQKTRSWTKFWFSSINSWTDLANWFCNILLINSRNFSTTFWISKWLFFQWILVLMWDWTPRPLEFFRFRYVPLSVSWKTNFETTLELDRTHPEKTTLVGVWGVRVRNRDKTLWRLFPLLFFFFHSSLSSSPHKKPSALGLIKLFPCGVWI